MKDRKFFCMSKISDTEKNSKIYANNFYAIKDFN